MLRLGVVSFLNARPLIEGLGGRDDVQCVFAVPAALPELLERGGVDAALVPTIDVLRSRGRLAVVSDACIGCDGETMTVRVFARVPPHRVRTLAVDPDSHTSVALARTLWRRLFATPLELCPLAAPPASEPVAQRRASEAAACDAVLLIGDKVVSPARGSFAYEVDLGGAWREHTGLPFVFAVWARRLPGEVATDMESARLTARTAVAPGTSLAVLLGAARDRGVARAEHIASEMGPEHGWPVEQARRYLTRCLRFTMDARAMAGAELFARWCVEDGLVEGPAVIRWPADLSPSGSGDVLLGASEGSRS